MTPLIIQKWITFILILKVQFSTRLSIRTWKIAGQEVVRPVDDGVIKTGLGQSLVPGSNWKVIQITDLNQDNSTDVVFQEKTSGQVVTWMLKNNVIQTTATLGTLAPTGAWSIEPRVKLTFDAETNLGTPLPGWTIAAVGNFSVQQLVP